jgi:hypothetical protein
MTVLGTVIDGFVVSNMMDETARAAAGLVSPAIILFAAVGTTAGISLQVRSVRCLSGGDLDGAHRAVSETLALDQMAMNVLEKGFTKDDKKHILSIRIVHKEDELIFYAPPQQSGDPDKYKVTGI